MSIEITVTYFPNTQFRHYSCITETFRQIRMRVGLADGASWDEQHDAVVGSIAELTGASHITIVEDHSQQSDIAG